MDIILTDVDREHIYQVQMICNFRPKSEYTDLDEDQGEFYYNIAFLPHSPGCRGIVFTHGVWKFVQAVSQKS